MRKITTSKGNEYPVFYAGIGLNGMLKAQLLDTRRLGDIAPEMEDNETVTYTNDETETEYAGYTILHRMERVDADNVMVMLAKEEQDGAVQPVV